MSMNNKRKPYFIADNLKYLLKDQNAAELCIYHGISRRTVTDLRVGNRTNPKIETVIKLCEIFKLTLDEFVRTDLSLKK